MAYDYESTQVAAANALVTPKYNANEVAANVRVALVDYVFDATETATDTIELFTTPANAKVIGYVIVSDAVATTATVDIGVAGGAADSICDGADVAAAGTDSGRCLVSADNAVIYATLATLDTPVAAKQLKFAIEYTI